MSWWWCCTVISSRQWLWLSCLWPRAYHRTTVVMILQYITPSHVILLKYHRNIWYKIQLLFKMNCGSVMIIATHQAIFSHSERPKRTDGDVVQVLCLYLISTPREVRSQSLHLAVEDVVLLHLILHSRQVLAKAFVLQVILGRKTRQHTSVHSGYCWNCLLTWPPTSVQHANWYNLCLFKDCSFCLLHVA